MTSIIVSREWLPKQGRTWLCNDSRPFTWGRSKVRAFRFPSMAEAEEFISRFWLKIPNDIAGEFQYDEVDDDGTNLRGLESSDAEASSPFSDGGESTGEGYTETDDYYDREGDEDEVAETGEVQWAEE